MGVRASPESRYNRRWATDDYPGDIGAHHECRVIDVPQPALAFGFGNSLVGTQTSRTIMLAELRLLLAACPPTASIEDYQSAVVADNVLLKPTVDTRRTTFRHLRNRYALSLDTLLFRALRDLWDTDEAGQPLLACLCAAARDPLLRATAQSVLTARQGEPIDGKTLAATLAASFPGRYNPTTLAATGERAVSSWAQAGHLGGPSRGRKVRARAKSSPVAVTYALLLGHLCGDRGDTLFGTFWANLLDAPAHVLREQAAIASQRGWIDLRTTGGVTEVGFRYLLRERPVAA